MERVLGVGFLLFWVVMGVVHLVIGNFEFAVRVLLSVFGLIALLLCIPAFWIGFPMLILVVCLATVFIK
jgi:hypothetical protein